MRTTTHIRRLVFGLMMAFGLIPAVAQAQDITIPGATDLLFTQPGTAYDFGAPIGVVPLFGVPTYAGGADTMVQRMGDADATKGTTINTLLTGLNLEGIGPTGPITVGLDPANLANDTGTMTFLTSGPTAPGTIIGGTITDTLNVYFEAFIPSVGNVFGHETFTSTGVWAAYLPPTSNEVTDFVIIIDTHVAPGGQHIVSSFAVPEPSTWAMLAGAGLIVPAYAVRRRRRA